MIRAEEHSSEAISRTNLSASSASMPPLIGDGKPGYPGTCIVAYLASAGPRHLHLSHRHSEPVVSTLLMHNMAGQRVDEDVGSRYSKWYLPVCLVEKNILCDLTPISATPLCEPVPGKKERSNAAASRRLNRATSSLSTSHLEA